MASPAIEVGLAMSTQTVPFSDEDWRRREPVEPASALKPAWSDQYQPGTVGFHELLDRTSLAASVVERDILGHPACAARRELSASARQALAALRVLFQKVVAEVAWGGRTPGRPDRIVGGEIRPGGGTSYPMAYSQFNLATACHSFGLVVSDRGDLFSGTTEAAVSDLLRATLDEQIPLATSIDTEKARSELIVAPILVEVRKLMDRRISLFSGISFDVDAERGLNGVCDFLLADSPVQLFLEAPVLAVVEAKNDNMHSGLGQCVAEMVAARVFNEREGKGPSIIYGLVTTGSLWQFLKLEEGTIHVDRTAYFLDQVGKILGILLHCVGGP